MNEYRIVIERKTGGWLLSTVVETPDAPGARTQEIVASTVGATLRAVRVLIEDIEGQRAEPMAK